jgi:diguanylate cyclase (GGDEF)-like protein
VVEAAGSGQQERRRRLRRGYVVASLGLIVVHPLLPSAWADVTLFIACGGAAACVFLGRRAVEPGSRTPWTLLLCALAVFVASNVALVAPDRRVVALGWLIDAVGNLLALAAALALIVRRGARDLGGIVDAAVIAFAAGGVLWAVLPRRLGSDGGFTAQIDLFVAVFALSGVLGALLRLTRTATEPGSALSWLLAAIGLAVAGNVVSSIGGGEPAPEEIAAMLFLGTFTAVGLFGLDPSGPRLMYPQAVLRAEQLSSARLVLLGAAVAVIPAVIGARLLLAGNPAGLLLTAQGALVAALVMVRIGILGAQRTRAERALAHQATHDPLTHLPNRRELIRRLRHELSRGDTRCALLYCDLDEFKPINDQFGHDAGDRLLVDVAHRLRSCIDQPHTVSRFGGDEFVILLIDVSRAQAEAIGDCVSTALSHPFEPVGGAGLVISIGIAQADGVRDPEQLIQRADHAMYEAKEAHRAPGPDRSAARVDP